MEEQRQRNRHDRRQDLEEARPVVEVQAELIKLVRKRTRRRPP
jgi:hypothetical protein